MQGTTVRTERDSRVIERVRAELLSGRKFSLVVASERSRYGYQPPLNRSGYAHCIQTLGRMAAVSDKLAQVATRCIKSINLYGTDGEERAHVYAAAAEALASGYDDVIGRAGPDAGRYRDHQHEFTLYDRVQISYWLNEATEKWQSGVPGVGWAIAALAEEVGYHHPAA